ncbi:MAG: (Fe-S)-binding protein, partial [Gammaproteobacteria bacterium]|nr:(Fe-S)-binding protein [Gemmatimonadota bacterium]NIU75396.1 (Fe-S)-binding protein [Gammaproteobacteria bacterium]
MRIALFMPCFNDTLFPSTGVATVRVLERLGHGVDFPTDQTTCCGQIHYNTGWHDAALPLLRRFVRVFGEAEAVVAPSASCVATVRDAYPDLARRTGDARLMDAVDALAPRVHELATFLHQQGQHDVGARFPHRVTYHPTCHSLRHLGVGAAPERLLDHVRELEYVPLPRGEECCGFGGTFAVKNV